MDTTDGTVEESPSGGFLIRFARTYSTTADDLWEAITDPSRLARWFAPVDGDLRVGGHWTARFDDGTFFTEGTVTACDPPRTFSSTWIAREERETTVVVSVDPVAGGAALRLEHDRVGSRDYAPGWHTYLELLELDLAGDVDGIATFDWDARYAELRARYRA